MSEDLINQLTLNCLISKHQLEKLNKKMKESAENSRKTDTEIYGQRITQLFNDLLVNEPPTSLLQEVKIGFDFFIDKCIYYFKAVDNDELLEKERVHDDLYNIIHDDIDYEKEEREIEKGNYEEQEVINNDDDNDDDIDDDIDDEKCLEKNDNKSIEVDNIQQLPLNWFQNVRENYKKHQIIPRKKL